MDKEQLLHEERRRGHEAQTLLDHPLWDGLWTQHREQLIAAWEKAVDTATRESYWLELSVAKRMRRKVERLAQTGRMAAEELEKDKH